MTQGDRDRFVRTRVWCCGCEIGSSEVFMKICTTDAYEGRCDLLIMSHHASYPSRIEHIP
jgi:hypothetical protein